MLNNYISFLPHCNKLPKVQCLKTIEMHYLTVLYVKSVVGLSWFLFSRFHKAESRCQLACALIRRLQRKILSPSIHPQYVPLIFRFTFRVSNGGLNSQASNLSDGFFFICLVFSMRKFSAFKGSYSQIGLIQIIQNHFPMLGSVHLITNANSFVT